MPRSAASGCHAAIAAITLLVASDTLSAQEDTLRAQDALRAPTLVFGPEVVKATATDVVVGLELDAPGAVELVAWKAQADESTAIRQRFSGQSMYEIPLPSGTAQYRLLLLDAEGKERGRTARFTTKPLDVGGSRVRRANIGTASIANGDVMTVTVEAVDVDSIRATWTPPGGTGQVSEVQKLQNGQHAYTFDLRHPDGRAGSDVVAVTLTASNGQSKVVQVSTMAASPAPEVALVGGAEITPTTNTLTFVVPVATTAPSLQYTLTLSDPLSFSLTRTGNCTPTGTPLACRIVASGLAPGLKYSYGLRIGVPGTPPTAWKEYVSAGPGGNTVVMNAVPRWAGGTDIVFMHDGMQVTVRSDRPTHAQLIYDQPPVNGTLGGQTVLSSPAVRPPPTTGQTTHTFKIPQALLFTQKGDTLRATLAVRLLDPATQQPIDSVPLIVGSNFAAVRSSVKRFDEKKIKDVVARYGPVAMRLLGF